MAELVLSFADALEVVLREARTITTDAVEQASLLDSMGRVLAEPVMADRDQPPFTRSTRDGYAMRAADAGGSLTVAGTVRAGEAWRGGVVRAGEAVEIMTGAPVPDGADAVVMVEHVVVDGDRLRLAAGRTIFAGENVVPQGAEARAGSAVLQAGTVIGAAEIAVAASCGCTTLPVTKKPLVAIVATGDELVELDREPEAWQIRNSNSYALAAMVRVEGGFGGKLAIARDLREDLWDRIAGGSMFDLLVLSGGVSMGKYDLVEEVLAKFGAEFFFTGALIQPGKPVVFGRIPKHGSYTTHENGTFSAPQMGDRKWTGKWTYFFGLPGNPVSTQVTFALFVAPLLRAMAGMTEITPHFVEARLAEDVKGGSKVTRFLPAEICGTWDGVSVRVVGWQGSGDLAANARGNCYAVLPPDGETIRAGDTVRVLLR